ncbi:MAG: glycosyltransferase family 4 protein [Terriglobia bacterium]|jgi:glycosyltransferase involved in cell wall biosynthesis|nr:glycosyltransferase family 4 protein [Terriglobia bacterium]
MRIALIASPFISVPPTRYGGTELFVAQLAEALKKLGFDVVVYANGQSCVNTELRWLYAENQWPIDGEIYSNLKDMNHCAWAIRDAWNDADIIHLNSASGLAFSRFDGPEFVYTIHHPHHDGLSEFYSHHPQVNFVCISRFQQALERQPLIRTIHHGVEMSPYKLQEQKKPYLAFLGRIAPLKGTHVAIEIAKKSGMSLKIAGEVQPLYRDYFESRIKPHIDGKFIEYVGEADLDAKNDLLGNAAALLFPIQWNEPFGLVMVEAMATGTPVLAFAGGSVAEVVKEKVSGHVCTSIDDMVATVKGIEGKFSPAEVRRYAEENFSVERMAGHYADLYNEIAYPSRKPAGVTADSEIEFIPDIALERELIAREAAEPDNEPEEPRAVA